MQYRSLGVTTGIYVWQGQVPFSIASIIQSPWHDRCTCNGNLTKGKKYYLIFQTRILQWMFQLVGLLRSPKLTWNCKSKSMKYFCFKQMHKNSFLDNLCKHCFLFFQMFNTFLGLSWLKLTNIKIKFSNFLIFLCIKYLCYQNYLYLNKVKPSNWK